jgi:outer membrane immunogenic protein
MNKLNSSVALAALAAISMAAPAIAADVAPPPPEPYNWTGFHIGAGGGGNFVFVDEDPSAYVDGACCGYHIEGDHSGDLGKADFFGTIEAGFDYQLGSSFVVGIFANYDFGKAKLKNTSNADLYEDSSFRGDGTFETEYEVGDSWAIGGRLGFLATDNALIYVLGGYTEADIKAESTIEASDSYPYPYYHTSENGWEDGWFVGGGIEALLMDNISLKAEYRFNDYGTVKNNNYDFIDSQYLRDAGNDQEADVTVHSVRAVLSYRFGLF